MRLLVHVEGQTEEDFIDNILRDHLVNVGYHSVAAKMVGNARIRQRRGGIRPWPSVRTDLVNHLREDPESISTTMVDYYALPQGGSDGWPGRDQASGFHAIHERALCVETAVRLDVTRTLGERFDARRFVPFVVMHEFEGLLFSDCAAFSRGIGRTDLESSFRAIRQGFATPEDINDSPNTAPSKRIQALVPGYQKPHLGVLAVLEIGLQRIRLECPHFDAWLTHLESLVA